MLLPGCRRITVELANCILIAPYGDSRDEQHHGPQIRSGTRSGVPGGRSRR